METLGGKEEMGQPRCERAACSLSQQRSIMTSRAGVAKLRDEPGCGILIKQVKVKVKAEVEITYAQSFSTLISASALIEEQSDIFGRGTADKEIMIW